MHLCLQDPYALNKQSGAAAAGGVHTMSSDEEMARRLQQQENSAAFAIPQPYPGAAVPPQMGPPGVQMAGLPQHPGCVAAARSRTVPGCFPCWRRSCLRCTCGLPTAVPVRPVLELDCSLWCWCRRARCATVCAAESDASLRRLWMGAGIPAWASFKASRCPRSTCTLGNPSPLHTQ